jgi:hypothetical protein
MKKILFLDFDGVMALSSEWGGRDKKIKKWKLANPEDPGYFNDPKIPAHIKMDNFNSKAVKVLNDILAATDAEIVISSDWKLYCTLDELKEMFTKYGVIKVPIDVTPNLPMKYDKQYYTEVELGEYRVIEIKNWMKEHPEVTQWVAIDDLPLGEKFGAISGNSNGGLTNFVLTPKSSQGIKQSGIKEKILKFLL